MRTPSPGCNSQKPPGLGGGRGGRSPWSPPLFSEVLTPLDFISRQGLRVWIFRRGLRFPLTTEKTWTFGSALRVTCSHLSKKAAWVAAGAPTAPARSPRGTLHGCESGAPGGVQSAEAPGAGRALSRLLRPGGAGAAECLCSVQKPQKKFWTMWAFNLVRWEWKEEDLLRPGPCCPISALAFWICASLVEEP
ncbi:uncharacterized protein LOC100967834 isoform X2 [Pan paniscus]|uniref:uncharacterized protein LOC100967834 isoform X2 n=1 Tax=Pan paniscus TaxID=9597 RepID=UPI0030070507